MEPRSDSKEITYIAVVDDDDSLCRSLSRLLRTAGLQPVTYSSAEAMLGDAKRPRFDCLVLDIQLSGMSGLELKRRLAAVKDLTPVIFITAYDEPEVRAEALDCGCAGYFRKNESGDQVLNAIRRAVGIIHDESSNVAPDSSPASDQKARR